MVFLLPGQGSNWNLEMMVSEKWEKTEVAAEKSLRVKERTNYKLNCGKSHSAITWSVEVNEL